MKNITTERLVLRRFKDSEYDDVFELLYQLRDNEFEVIPNYGPYENMPESLCMKVNL